MRGSASIPAVRPAGLREVAGRAGLSQATVSRALNGHPSVRPATAERAERAARELGYVPSQAARLLAGRRSDTLAVVFPVVASGFFAEVLDGIDQEAAAAGFGLETVFTRHRHNERELLARCVAGRRSEAVLVMNVMLDGHLVRRAVEMGVPLVLLDRPMPGHDVPAILVDNFGGARAAMAHLLGRGCRRVAVLTGPADSYDSAERLRGCRRAVEKVAGATMEVWPGDFSESGGHARAAHELARGARPDAVFALNDAMAFGAMEAFGEIGLDVPGDVLFAGFDDIAAARHLSLTTVRSPMREMGRLACRTAVALARGEKPPAARQFLPCDLIVRRSSRRDPLESQTPPTRRPGNVAPTPPAAS